MTMPSLELFTQPHVRRHAGNSKWGEFFGSMEVNEIKVLPEELQQKKSLHGYVPKNIRTEFVFRTNPEDGKRYVARLKEEQKPTNRSAVESSQKPQEAAGDSETGKVAPTPIRKKKATVEAVVPGIARMEPPTQFDA